MSAGAGRGAGHGTVVARAPAKVNAQLQVGPLREDGFHDLRTVYLAVSLFDTVTVRPDDRLSLTVSGEGSGADGGPATVPTDSGNLAWRAAELLAQHAGVAAHAAIDIAKSIPAAAGLAGGSADAAAALVALDSLWGTRATRADLAGLAAELGSDVPFSLVGGVALGTGRGEQLSPVLARRRSDWVLGIAGEGLSTPRVYAELDRLRAAGHARVHDAAGRCDAVITALHGGPTEALAAALGNDLQAPALSLRPDLQRALRAAEEAGARRALVSGSGPTVAALVDDEDAAVRVAAELAGAGVFRTVRAVHGPVPGARLVG
ncbi:4-(cytidine 5'-diphospho)-2-C-methyl-D-erythritol kinase [Modestobacter sp. I12A-02628]|uniref:4-diphosphocytidyl-2-C-methyl-D-erythritol kinase n=1 Tax=Goekera deserti TaxID=2497753 RepID=A0A7K3WGJ7_9ACTN|nr:4-(cytidine 5'-diphospho)-2-C-methyl-D-erythritol kinase [Goekera deserti]MPQ99411.1 4-(cytidine 5'-diphospho)-2-C-methyl-D-erythritol kinase [Goekera deserti]NDI48898.1 4-(cytidine 5'-diphospho)-2-C-methyl-D-erythritol kinase [Goekera deserti]NEL55631.1 4-(cytidine 5'-diphospho)-2-C-methyl-D-erythritol kinase [Goekera deserti]